ncbi:winged helix-turn-helix transcriptional regulator [Candidatus Marsarchaeota archaeon]|nr:winged helix-turn-helix transcriptional regulator [Candidatus Marsarchaeota archaeon]MCL5100288.1 winged helix-turn-helix transcriptional regulator [Candidatus Marsarchaeota archaeon]
MAAENCPVSKIMRDEKLSPSEVGHIMRANWRMAVVSMLAPRHDGMFYNELLAQSGLTAKTLSAVLKDLAKAGFVDREVIDTAPIRVKYALTTAGIKLIGLGCPLIELAAAQSRK